MIVGQAYIQSFYSFKNRDEIHLTEVRSANLISSAIILTWICGEDVLAHRAVHQTAVLVHHADLCQQTVLSDAGNVLTVDQDALAVLRACGVNVAEMQQQIESYLETDLSYLVNTQISEAKPTTAFQRVL